MDKKKKQYNKLRAYLAVFGISYSHYIRECDGVLPLNPEGIKDVAVYYDIIHKMCNSDEGFMYWYFLRLVWTEFSSNNIPMSAMKKKPLDLSGLPLYSAMSNGKIVNDVHESINLIKVFLSLGFKFSFEIINDKNYLNVIYHFMDDKNVKFFKNNDSYRFNIY